MQGAKHLLILAGGESEEHEVSLLSAKSVRQAARVQGLPATLRVVAKDGRLLAPERTEAALAAGSADEGQHSLLHLADALGAVDCVFPLIHGPRGEDGTLQGLLELLNVPYVGSGVLASALCMDKPMAKEVLQRHDIPQVPYVTLTRAAYAEAPEQLWPEVQARLGAGPWFVKPANMGSSVGVSKAKDLDGLARAVTLALRLDRRAIVEQGLSPVRELEVAILGNDAPKASPVGEITYQGEFYDYATKYTEGQAQMVVPAHIPAAVQQEIQRLALRAYKLLDCAGLARVDFFYQPGTGQLALNEINTLPGFTAFSMYPTMWQAAGLPYPDLVAQLVALAHARHPIRGRRHTP